MKEKLFCDWESSVKSIMDRLMVKKHKKVKQIHIQVNNIGSKYFNEMEIIYTHNETENLVMASLATSQRLTIQ